MKKLSLFTFILSSLLMLDCTIENENSVTAEDFSPDLSENDFDEVDLYKFADELIKSLQPEKQKDHFRDPGIKRDYRNYALDKAFEKHQDEIFLREESIYDFENDYETEDLILKNFIIKKVIIIPK